MDFRHTDYFLTIMRVGSITGAAKELHISQPALSQYVKQIENELGVQLFNRETTPMSLSYAGELYLNAAQDNIEIKKNLMSQLSELTHKPHGRLRIGIAPSRGTLLLPRLIPAFYQKYPYIIIDLIEHNTLAVLQSLLEGACDFAFLTITPSEDRLVYKLLERSRVVLLASKRTVFSKNVPNGTEIKVLDAQNEKFILFSKGGLRQQSDRLFEMYQMKPKVVMELLTVETALGTLQHMDAVVICYDTYLHRNPEAMKHVNCYPLQVEMENTNDLFLCYHKNLYLTKYMTDFIKITQDQFTIEPR